uniref:protein-serine/threonine phosphatase n=1 Tax=Kalanchoe fedtschenkoi TaxID=63787 RepID=A0A7N0V050_KALFE
MFKSVVYRGNEVLGEVEVSPQNNVVKLSRDDHIRITHFSPPSERCPPLAVLHTITSSGLCFKMESAKSQQPDPKLIHLHNCCIKENKTAVVALGEEELHLVAMLSKMNERQHPCFWGYYVKSGLYDSCLIMLNIRCLGIVFDLDETLIVANTMRSFEDRIESLQRKINAEVDPQRLSGMLAEAKRYQDDKAILKQFIENDQIVESGRTIRAQSEVVPALSDNHVPLIRPVIRLQEKNIVLTRINPLIRDTSVLVRLRPAWEDLRNYLTARGRKRFEVYVCTMAERDYALEMWRLLDPEFNLINSRELLDRVVCVKSGLKKSLFNVFQDGTCHPKMSLVIDDRLRVWDEKDQPRVHVVPAFAPYYAPQAEDNFPIPILCMARNVACNVRGGFFKDFDDALLRRVDEASFESDAKDIPFSPDVSNYLVSEDESAALNVTKNPTNFDGMADVEVERRLKEAVLASSSHPPSVANLEPRLAPSFQYTLTAPSNSMPLPPSQVPFLSAQFPQVGSLINPVVHEPSFRSSPAREEGEVPESELDPDTRRRLLILQHGQDNRDNLPVEPSFPARPSIPIPVPPVQVPAPVPPVQVAVPRGPSRGNWFPEDDMNSRKFNRPLPNECPLDAEGMHMDDSRGHHPSFFRKVENSPSGRFRHSNTRQFKEAFKRDHRLKPNHPGSNFNSYHNEEHFMGRSTPVNRSSDFDSEQNVPYSENPANYLQEIAIRLGTKAEFKSSLVDSIELQFCMEVWFAGEKVGDGIGKTRREAQSRAAEASLMQLADRYIKRSKADLHGDGNNDDGFLNDVCSFGEQPFHKDEAAGRLDHRTDASRKASTSVSALNELCMEEGLTAIYQNQPQFSNNSSERDEVYAQVEIDGQVMGKGVGLTWDEARMQAAERALGYLRSTLGQYGPKRQGSPRSFQGMPSKRYKPDFQRNFQRMPSARYPRNASPIP